jgi:hypothetical protein
VDLFLYPDVIHLLSPLNRFCFLLEVANNYIISRTCTYHFTTRTVNDMSAHFHHRESFWWDSVIKTKGFTTLVRETLRRYVNSHLMANSPIAKSASILDTYMS